MKVCLKEGPDITRGFSFKQNRMKLLDAECASIKKKMHSLT